MPESDWGRLGLGVPGRGLADSRAVGSPSNQHGIAGQFLEMLERVIFQTSSNLSESFHSKFCFSLELWAAERAGKDTSVSFCPAF